MCSTLFWIDFFSSAGIPHEDAVVYASNFTENRVTKTMLPDLDRQILVDLGVQLVGHSLAIIRHAKKITGRNVDNCDKPIMPVDKTFAPGVRTVSYYLRQAELDRQLANENAEIVAQNASLLLGDLNTKESKSILTKQTICSYQVGPNGKVMACSEELEGESVFGRLGARKRPLEPASFSQDASDCSEDDSPIPYMGVLKQSRIDSPKIQPVAVKQRLGLPRSGSDPSLKNTGRLFQKSLLSSLADRKSSADLNPKQTNNTGIFLRKQEIPASTRERPVGQRQEFVSLNSVEVRTPESKNPMNLGGVLRSTQSEKKLSDRLGVR